MTKTTMLMRKGSKQLAERTFMVLDHALCMVSQLPWSLRRYDVLSPGKGMYKDESRRFMSDC
jgi:hypothetical protein